MNNEQETLIKAELEAVRQKVSDFEAGRAVILTAQRYNELLNMEHCGVVEIYKTIERARKEAFEEVFNYMYKLILSAEEGCEITVTSSDIKEIALKKYGVQVRE